MGWGICNWWRITHPVHQITPWVHAWRAATSGTTLLIRDSNSEQNVTGARWILFWPPLLGVNIPSTPSTYGATRASRLAKLLGRLSGKPPRNSGRRLWQGLCLLSGDLGKEFNDNNLIFINFFPGEWAAGYWCPCPSAPPSEPGQKCKTHDINSTLFRSLNKCYWIRGIVPFSFLVLSSSTTEWRWWRIK